MIKHANTRVLSQTIARVGLLRSSKHLMKRKKNSFRIPPCSSSVENGGTSKRSAFFFKASLFFKQMRSQRERFLSPQIHCTHNLPREHYRFSHPHHSCQIHDLGLPLTEPCGFLSKCTACKIKFIIWFNVS